jgi:hypothetical protein
VNTAKEALIIAAVGLAAAGYAGGKIARAIQSGKWRRAIGTVVESSIARDTDNNADGRSKTNYELRVRYSYSVDGQTFTGDRQGFFGRTTRHLTQSEAEAYLQRIAPGGAIEVWYDPAKPAESVQDRAIPAMWWIVLALGLVFTLGGAVPILLGRVQ